MTVRIGLVHATRLSIEPIERAFADAWPEAETANLLDEALLAEHRRANGLTPNLFWRFAALAHLAEGAGARAILFTCSAFGPAIDAAAQTVSVPVLRPYTAMIEAALDAGARIGLVATFAGSLPEMQDEVARVAAARGRAVQLAVGLAAGAMEALAAGRADEHDARIAEAAKGLGRCDAVMLAQFSMARAKAKVAAAIGVPVFTAPDCAVRRLKGLVGGGE